MRMKIMRMKIKIDAKGLLKIFRRNEYRYQTCPRNNQYCGDWCPLFSIYEQITKDCDGEDVYFRELRLCHSMYQLDGFEQEKQQQMELTFEGAAPPAPAQIRPVL